MRRLILCALVALAGCGTTADRAAYRCRDFKDTPSYGDCFRREVERDRRGWAALAGMSFPSPVPIATPHYAIPGPVDMTAGTVPARPTPGMLDTMTPYYTPAPAPETHYVPVAPGDPLNAGVSPSGYPTR